MKLNLFQRQSATPRHPKNPTNFSQAYLHEKSNSIVQIFHRMNYHVLEPFYKFAIQDFGPENVLCILALLDFEMIPTTEKRDFIMRHFVDANSAFEVNIPGSTRTQIKQQVALENTMKANARRGRSGAFMRFENRPVVLSQSPTTFGNFMDQALLNASDTWSRYSVDYPPSGEIDNFLPYRQFAQAMQAAGFNVPHFMLTIGN